MLPLEQKQTLRQMSLMRTTCPGKLVWFTGIREINVLYAYIIHAGFLLQTPHFHYSLKVCVSSHVHRTRSKSSLWCCCSSAGSPSALCGAAAGVFSVHGTGWWAENTAGAGHCNVLQCSSLCYTHPLPSILALPLTIAQSAAPLRLPPSFEHFCICPAILSLLYSPCFSHHVESPPHP